MPHPPDYLDILIAMQEAEDISQEAGDKVAATLEQRLRDRGFAVTVEFHYLDEMLPDDGHVH